MLNITLKQLRYFEALARLGHFGHAAETCAVTQPALSMQIRDLEAALESKLFERTPRGVRLTAFGAVFAERVKDILRDVDELGDLARASRDGFVGRLAIGIIPTIAPYILPGLVAAMERAFPDVTLEFRETVTQNLIAELLEGRLDTAIVALPVSEHALTEVPLFSEAFILVRPHGQADLPPPDREALREMRLLLLEEGHCFRDQALSFCGFGPKRSKDLLDASSLSTLVQMVGAGIGVTLIPEMAVPVELRSAPVAAVRLAGQQPSRTIGMVWRKGHPLTDRYAALAEVVKDATGATGAGAW